MPWVEKPKKDVIGCEKPRSGASNRDQPRMSEWGNPSCTTGCHMTASVGSEISQYHEEKKS